MKLLLLLSWPYARKHLLRTALTISGIAIGVAVLVGMHSANTAVSESFRQTVDRIAGKSQLQITAGETGIPESILETVQSFREVAAAAPVIEATVNTGTGREGNLMLLGVDMTGDRSLRDYDLEPGGETVIDDPLVFLAQPDSLIVSRDFAARNGLASGSAITLRTMQGPKRFTIRGLMSSGGLAGAFGGNLAIMDIYAAQAVFGRGRTFDRIDIGVAEGTGIDDCRRMLESALGPAYTVERPEARGAHFDSMVRALTLTVHITSIFALIIGVFIIYNSFSIAVTQRRAEIGILRALGAESGQIQRLFLLEGLLAGTAGSAAGALIGRWASGELSSYMSRIVESVYGAAQWAETIEPNKLVLLAATAAGIAASLAGAWLPARAAASIDPTKAIQKGRTQILSAGESRFRRIAAFALLAAALACMKLGDSLLVIYAGFAMAVTAPLFLAPFLSLWTARLLRPVLRWILPVEGALAADSLLQAPRRTSACVAALMLSLALAIGFAGISGAMNRQIEEWIRTRLNADLLVTTSDSIRDRKFLFPASMEAELSRIPGVEAVLPARSARVPFHGAPALAIALDIRAFIQRAGISVVEGDHDRMVEAAASGKGVILSDNLAVNRRLKIGDMVDLPTPSGVLRLPVAGTILDFSDDQGSFMIDRSLFRNAWKDDAVSTFRIYVRSGFDRMAVRQAILDRFSGNTRLFVLTNVQVREFVMDTAAKWFAIAHVQLAVAVMVAMLGIINSLTVSITDRRRELGVLQAVGALRGQVRRTIWMEAAAIGIIGLLLGIAVGAVLLYFNLDLLRRTVAGFRLPYEFPMLFSAQLIPVILSASWLSSLWPAEAALRAPLSESLEYE